MQNLIMYAVAESTLGLVRDYANAKGMNPPVFTKGFSALIRLRLFAELDNTDPYPAEQLQTISSWQCIWDKDYNSATAPVIVADNEKIFVNPVLENINGTDRTFTEIVIPVSNMNTQELDTVIGNSESVGGLCMELVGFDSTGSASFGLQIKGFTVRNRVYHTGTPTEIKPDYLTASEVRALIASGVVFQFSVDTNEWHDGQTADDRFVRFRSASTESAIWSSPIELISGSGGGSSGADGISTYTYVAYAIDASGNGFSVNPTNDLKYRAEIHVHEPIEKLSITDFANAVWVKYIGDNGTPGGGTSVTVDSELSATSANPVQNKVIKSELDKKITTPVGGTAGQVLSTDGAGNVSWTTPKEGTDVTVDSALSTTSTNPVQNAVITNKINELSDAVNTLNTSLTGVEDALVALVTTAEGI